MYRAIATFTNLFPVWVVLCCAIALVYPAAFTWFDTQRYWQDRVLELREQIAAMQEGPLPLF